jgi:hypothetical protein
MKDAKAGGQHEPFMQLQRIAESKVERMNAPEWISTPFSDLSIAGRRGV